MGMMNWLGIGKDISEPINAIGNLYTTDKARIEAETKFEEQMQKPIIAQMTINQVLAASNHFFNSGWQPLIGWTSGFLILLYWAPQLILANYIWVHKCLEAQDMVPFPLKPDDIMNLIYLAFGFGGYALMKKKFN